MQVKQSSASAFSLAVKQPITEVILRANDAGHLLRFRTCFHGSSLLRPKLLQEVSRRNEVVRLEALRKSVEDRLKKSERFVSLAPISPKSCEADANTQL